MMNLHETCYEVLHGQNIIQLYLFCKLICKSLLVLSKKNIWKILNRYLMFGRVFAKNTSRETKHFPIRKAVEI